MGSDERTLSAVIKGLKSLGISDEAIEKSLNTAGLLAKKKEIMVNGKPVFKVYWVNPKNEEKEKEKAERENAKQNQKNVPKEKKQELEDYEKPEKEKKRKDEDDLPDDVKENIGHAHAAPSGKKPVGVVLHDKNSDASVKKELDKHGIKPVHIDPEKLKHHTERAIDHAADHKKHITYDASKPDSTHHEKVVKKLKDRGYDVHEIGKK